MDQHGEGIDGIRVKGELLRSNPNCFAFSPLVGGLETKDGWRQPALSWGHQASPGPMIATALPCDVDFIGHCSCLTIEERDSRSQKVPQRVLTAHACVFCRGPEWGRMRKPFRLQV